MGFYIKDAGEVARIRQAGALVARTLDYISDRVVPGVTLKQLAESCREFIVQHDAKPAFLGYRGFPARFARA